MCVFVDSERGDVDPGLPATFRVWVEATAVDRGYLYTPWHVYKQHGRGSSH